MYAQKYLNLNSEERNFCLTASYHEAGHALAAYLVGWKVENIHLEISDKGILINGATPYIKYDDEDVVTSILNYNNYPELYNNLVEEKKEMISQTISKRLAVLISGPAAEVRYKESREVNFSDLVQSVGDYFVYLVIQNFLNLMPQYSGETIAEIIATANNIFSCPTIWKNICALQVALLQNDELYLKQEEVNEIFETNGFFEMIRDIDKTDDVESQT